VILRQHAHGLRHQKKSSDGQASGSHGGLFLLNRQGSRKV
jgi:hypothetical protein